MPPDSQSQTIADELRGQILRGRYRAGDRLPSERELANLFHVHRGPVREALKKLEQMGLAAIRPGGARVCPIETASLDVLSHLLVLSDPPDTHVVQMVFEVSAALSGLTFQLGVERGSDEQMERCLDLLDRLAKPDLNPTEEHEIALDLSATMVEASGNLVLALVHRGIRLQFLENLEHREELLRSPPEIRASRARAIAAALSKRDSHTVSKLLSDMASQIGKNAIRIIESEHAATEESREKAYWRGSAQ